MSSDFTTIIEAAPIRDASTIIVLDRKDPALPKVLMGQRGKGAVFMPSKFVFPGGGVDANDAEAILSAPLSDLCAHRLSQETRPESSATPHSLAAAALRELAEETGLFCGKPGDSSWSGYQKKGLSPDPSPLIYFFRAITPPRMSRRFDTRFFLLDTAHLNGDPTDFSDAEDELSNIHWVPLAEARALDLPFITEVVLAEVQALVARFPSGPLTAADSVPFFDNRTASPRFQRIV